MCCLRESRRTLQADDPALPNARPPYDDSCGCIRSFPCNYMRRRCIELWTKWTYRFSRRTVLYSFLRVATADIRSFSAILLIFTRKLQLQLKLQSMLHTGLRLKVLTITTSGIWTCLHLSFRCVLDTLTQFSISEDTMRYTVHQHASPHSLQLYTTGVSARGLMTSAERRYT